MNFSEIYDYMMKIGRRVAILNTIHAKPEQNFVILWDFNAHVDILALIQINVMIQVWNLFESHKSFSTFKP